MSFDILNLMQRLDACHGVSGNEKEIAALLTELAQPFVDEITTDVMGNLFCHKKGSGPRVMFAAHMDSIGFIVTHVEEKGYLRVGKVGGIGAPADIERAKVIFNIATGELKHRANINATFLCYPRQSFWSGTSDQIEQHSLNRVFAMMTKGDMVE